LKPEFGHYYILDVGKPSGNFQFEGYRYECGDHYDPNEMGFLTNNNEVINFLRLSYLTFNPFWKILSTQLDFIVTHSTLYKPADFKSLQLQVVNKVNFSNFWSNYLEGDYYPMVLPAACAVGCLLDDCHRYQEKIQGPEFGRY
jgi:hypothetical protein